MGGSGALKWVLSALKTLVWSWCEEAQVATLLKVDQTVVSFFSFLFSFAEGGMRGLEYFSCLFPPFDPGGRLGGSFGNRFLADVVVAAS